MDIGFLVSIRFYFYLKGFKCRLIQTVRLKSFSEANVEEWEQGMGATLRACVVWLV